MVTSIFILFNIWYPSVVSQTTRNPFLSIIYLSTSLFCYSPIWPVTWSCWIASPNPIMHKFAKFEETIRLLFNLSTLSMLAFMKRIFVIFTTFYVHYNCSLRYLSNILMFPTAKLCPSFFNKSSDNSTKFDNKLY